MFCTYILYSTAIDSYYVGFTTDVMSERLRRPNSNHKGFTGRASDWTVMYTETFPTKAEAMRREKEIKSKRAEPILPISSAQLVLCIPIYPIAPTKPVRI